MIPFTALMRGINSLSSLGDSFLGDENCFLRPKSREPKEKAKEITRKMRGSLRAEPMDLSSILEGYAGDESSYNVSGSDSGSESEFPLGISRRDGWKDGIRISSRSRSFPASCISFGGPKTNMQCETLGQDSYLMAGGAMNRGKNKAIKRNSNKKEDCSSRKIRSNNKKSQSSCRTYPDSTDSFGKEQFNLSQVEINLGKKDPAEQMSLVSHMRTHNINGKSSINDAEVDGGHADMYSESLDEELPSKSSSCLLGNPTSSTPGPEDSKAQVPQIGPSEDETVQLQCPVLEPQSPASAKEADHPSLVSVLEAPFVEDVNIISPGSECFERVNADLHGLRMQLKLLKMESRANADGLMLTPSDKDVGQGFVSVSEDNEVFDDESWKSVYLADVLIASGYDDADPDTFVSTWYSLDCPLDPRLFDNVEEKYSSETTSLRSERKLLFDRINSGLFEMFHQFVDPLPWVKQPTGKVGLTRQKHGIGYELHKLLASEEKSMHEDMTERVLDRKMQWLDSGDGVDAIGMEIEKLLMDDLIVEVANILAATAAVATSGEIQSTPKLKEVVSDNFKKILLQGMDLNQFVQIYFKVEGVLVVINVSEQEPHFALFGY
ncbi:hypothetical protein LOK49_LG06G00279 [Camellia lanceoleosa]|uniref:Uncharacterized protein n=1 Tax=Camellia lanceoleosa TaxID=1840588 RepID=A0ACC0HD15_9ERIC|nr:hypothetical protein LOK49_LG06G00279 [Camellia lanceoleosa]